MPLLEFFKKYIQKKLKSNMPLLEFVFRLYQDLEINMPDLEILLFDIH